MSGWNIALKEMPSFVFVAEYLANLKILG